MGFKIHQILFFALGVITLAFLCIPPQREQAIMLAQRSSSDIAIISLQDVLHANPGDKRALEMIVPLLLKDKQNATIINLITKYRQQKPSDIWAKDFLVNFYQKLFYYQKALAILNENRQQNYVTILKLLVEIGDLNEAIKILKEQLKHDKSDYAIWEQIKTYQEWSMNVTGIIEALQGMVKTQHKHNDLASLIETLLWQGKIEQALPYAKELLMHNKCACDDYKLLTTFYIRARDIPNAIISSQKLCQHQQATIHDWEDLAYLYSWSNQTAKALNTINQTAKQFGYKEKICWMGTVFSKKINNNKQYIFYLTKLAELKQDGAMFLYIADLLIKDKKYPRAKLILKQIIDKGFPQTKTAYVKIIGLHLRQKKRQLAMDDLQNIKKTIGWDNLSVENLIDISNFYARLLDTEKQNKLLRLASKRNSKQATRYLANIYLERYWRNYAHDTNIQRQVNRNKAIKALTKLKPFGLSAAEKTYLISLFIDDNNYRLAKTEYQTYQTKISNIDKQMLQMSLDKNDLKLAKHIIRKFDNSKSNINILALKAYFYEKTNDIPMAILNYRKLLDLQPGKQNIQNEYYRLVAKIGGIVPRPIKAKVIIKNPPQKFAQMNKRNQLLTKAYNSDAGKWHNKNTSWLDTYTAYSNAIAYINKAKQ